MAMRRCGDCGTEVPDGAALSTDPDRCPCGARAITRLAPGGVLVHAPGCDLGGSLECPCADALSGAASHLVQELDRREAALLRFREGYGDEWDEAGERAFDSYWRTRATEPSGLVVLEREEWEQVVFWLRREPDGVVVVG